MRKNGFTLIELIGIITLIAIVSLVVLPSIVNVTKNSENNKKEENLNTLYMAAENYVTLNYENFTSLGTVGNYEYVKVLTLVNENYVKSDMLNPNTDENFTNYDVIKLTKKEDYTYSFELTKLNGIYDMAKGLVYENDLCKSDSTYSYMNGCYIKGSNTQNYVWYSGFLWRIMGINSDGTVRLITEENVTSIPWYAETSLFSTFSGSYAEKWLNKYFINNLKDIGIISNYNNWCSALTSETDSSNINCTGTLFNDPVGLLSVDEYNLALGSDSYLNNGQTFSTLTPNSDSDLLIIDAGTVSSDSVASIHGLRAVINIRPESIVTSGTGTISEPYFINQSSNQVTGNLSNIATSGEYIEFSNHIYRVVDVNEDGTTKIILNDYYEDMASFGTDNIFTTESGIGQILNTTVLEDVSFISSTYKNMIVTNSIWYQTDFDFGYSYELSLDETDDTKKIVATIGLIRVGEMLSSNVGDNSYWLLNTTTDSTKALNLSATGSLETSDVTSSLYLRPVFNLKKSVQVTGGNGTINSPYTLK